MYTLTDIIHLFSACMSWEMHDLWEFGRAGTIMYQIRHTADGMLSAR